MKKIAVFGSGSGTNTENICRFFSDSTEISVVLIVTNNEKAFIVKRAKKLSVPVFVISKNDLYTFTFLQKKLIACNVDYIILAGFLLKIPKKMVLKYRDKIINLHPSLLPKYGGKGMYGKNVHKSVLENNEEESGITIHLVNEFYDDGRILLQKKVFISNNETVNTLSKKITLLEHKYFPLTIKNYIL